MGLRPSGRQVFHPQPDEAPDVVGKIGEPDLHAGSRRSQDIRSAHPTENASPQDQDLEHENMIERRTSSLRAISA